MKNPSGRRETAGSLFLFCLSLAPLPAFAAGKLFTATPPGSDTCSNGRPLGIEEIRGLALPGQDRVLLLKCDCECTINENELQVLGVKKGETVPLAQYEGYGLRLVANPSAKDAVFSIVQHVTTGISVEMDEDTVRMAGGSLQGANGVPHPGPLADAALIARLAGMGAPADGDIRAKVAKTKALKTRAALDRALLDLGVDRDSLKHLQYAYNPPEKGGVTVERAETFLQDLDGDGKREAVSQIVFSDPPEMGKSALDYLFLIHSGSETTAKPVYARIFGLMRCGYVKSSGMRFSIKAGTAGMPGRILFRITKVSNCDAGGQDFDRGIDTLALQSGEWTYALDASPKATHRMGDPEGP